MPSPVPTVTRTTLFATFTFWHIPLHVFRDASAGVHVQSLSLFVHVASVGPPGWLQRGSTDQPPLQIS